MQEQDEQILAREALNATRKAIEEGDSIVQKARDDYRLDAPDNADGPKMQNWKQGGFVELAPSPLNESLVELIKHIVNFDRAGRWISAAMALARLREQYDGFDTRDLPADESSWEGFTAKHVPMPPARIAELIGYMVHSGDLISCQKCSAKSKAVCGCGAPYLSTHRWAMPRCEPMEPTVREPSALDRAAEAITTHPEKSDRALATEIGVSHQTIKRARERAKTADGDVTDDVTVDGRVGRDGRRRKLPGRASAGTSH